MSSSVRTMGAGPDCVVAGVSGRVTLKPGIRFDSIENSSSTSFRLRCRMFCTSLMASRSSASLRKAPPSSPDWPPPYVMCLTLMRTGGDLYVAARLIGHEITSLDHRKTVEAAFTLAVRRLAGRWASGPVPKTPQRSEAQSVAEFGSEAA